VVGSLFFEPEASSQQELWEYVGDGKGGYRKVKSFDFAPGGAYVKEPTGCSSCTKCCCVFLIILMLLALGLGIGYLADPKDSSHWLQALSRWSRETWASATAPRSGASSGQIQYDCKIKSLDDVKGWSNNRRTWCCEEQRVLCPSECDAGSEDVVKAWSSMKKQWCCEEFRVGCDDSQVSSTPANRGCTASCNRDNESATCQDRIAWLARNRYPGSSDSCKSATREVVKHCPSCSVCSEDRGPECSEFDCEADLTQWKSTWPSDKQRWCCSTEGKGCPAGTVGGPGNLPFHCGVGLSSAAWGWSADKKEWCCKNQDIACEDEVEFQYHDATE